MGRWGWVMAVALVGCRGEALEAPPDAGVARPAPVGGTGPRAPMGPLPLGVARPDEARVRIDLAGVRAAVREHQMVHDGANPASISAMDLHLSFPGDLVYDPGTGTVQSKTYPQY
jgi:hypothetical protein